VRDFPGRLPRAVLLQAFSLFFYRFLTSILGHSEYDIYEIVVHLLAYMDVSIFLCQVEKICTQV